MNDEQIAADARERLAEIVAALRAAEIATEALAELMPEQRRFALFKRQARMQPIGEVWRLGALLLSTDAHLYTAGKLTRAAERGRVGYQSISREERRDIAAAALRGGYPTGTPVNYDAEAIDLHTAARAEPTKGHVIGFSDGDLRVRWRPDASLAGAPTLSAYLTERAELLIHPPLSAT